MNTALLETINRKCEAKIWYGDAAQEQELIPTGIPQLDAAVQGIPKGRLVEIFGSEDSGKTTLALHLAGRLKGPILFVDADRKLSPHMLHGDDLYLLNVETLEEAIEACQLAINGGFKAVVVDTLTALPTRYDMELSINDKHCPSENLQADGENCVDALYGACNLLECICRDFQADIDCAEVQAEEATV